MTKQPTTPPADRRGLALTAGHDAAALYCEGVDRLLCLARGAAEHLESSVQEDPHFELAWAALALAHLVEGHADLARAVLLPERGDRVAGDPATPPLTPRERGHLAALAACVRGDDAAACRLAQRHLREYPRDTLVFACLVISAQAGGDLAARQRALRFASEIAPANGDDWAFLMLHARLLEELARAAEALPLALRALTLRPDCAPAARIVAQAHHERGDHRAGLKLLGAWLWTFIPSAPAVVQLRVSARRPPSGEGWRSRSAHDRADRTRRVDREDAEAAQRRGRNQHTTTPPTRGGGRSRPTPTPA